MRNKRSESIPGYLYALDGLRAISLVFIYIFHAWQQSWVFLDIKNSSGEVLFSFETIQRFGYIAIDSFFVLSGFCLFYPIARSMFGESKQTSWKDFYIKRAKRILPSYFFILLVMAFIPDLEYMNYTVGFERLKHFLLSIFFAQNCHVATHGGLVSTAWTLVIEVHFYLIFPVMTYLFKKKPFLSFIGTLIVSECARLHAVSNIRITNVSQSLLIFYLDIFACGMFCAYLVVYARHKLPYMQKLKIPMTLISIISIYIVYLFMGWMGSTNIPDMDGATIHRFIYRPLLDIMIAVFIFTACNSMKFWEKGVWGNRVAVFLSTISYNFYLWHQNIHIYFKRHTVDSLFTLEEANNHVHEPMVRFMLFTLAVSFVIAVAVTYLIEKPFYKYGIVGLWNKLFSSNVNQKQKNKKKQKKKKNKQ